MTELQLDQNMKTQIDKATPRPWKVASEATATILAPSKTGLRIVAVCDGLAATDNAALIVRAVNTIDEITAQRDALLAACKEAERCMSFTPRQPEPAFDSRCTNAMIGLRQAIALAEGGAK